MEVRLGKSGDWLRVGNGGRLGCRAGGGESTSGGGRRKKNKREQLISRKENDLGRQRAKHVGQRLSQSFSCSAISPFK